VFVSSNISNSGAGIPEAMGMIESP